MRDEEIGMSTRAIAILREKGAGEIRVIATPREIARFVAEGFSVAVEKGAGIGVGIADADYASAGAVMLDTEEAWGFGNFIVKYKPPTDQEFGYLNSEKTICAVFHAEGNKDLVRRLMESKCTAYSYEFFRTPDGIFPLSVASSEIAGKVAVIYGAYHLQTHLGGSGKLLASVVNAAPLNVLVIGYGNSGGAAARLAAAMGARVTVLGTSRERLRAFQATMPNDVRCLLNDPVVLEREILAADLVIGAILISTFDTPAMVPESLVKKMKPGSMIVDVTAGYYSGYLPSFDRNTTFQFPVYERFGVLHCKIDVLPLAYARTTVEAMSQHLAPYIARLAQRVYDESHNDLVSDAGKIVSAGEITHPEVKRHFYHE